MTITRIARNWALAALVALAAIVSLLTTSTPAQSQSGGTVTSADIVNQTIQSEDIGPGGVGTSELREDAVSKSRIRADAVGKSEVGADTIGRSELQPGVEVRLAEQVPQWFKHEVALPANTTTTVIAECGLEGQLVTGGGKDVSATNGDVIELHNGPVLVNTDDPSEHVSREWKVTVRNDSADPGNVAAYVGCNTP